MPEGVLSPIILEEIKMTQTFNQNTDTFNTMHKLERAGMSRTQAEITSRAIDQQISLSRQEVLDKMDERFDVMDKRFDAMNERFNERFDVMNERFIVMNERLDAVEKKFETRFDAIEKRLSWGLSTILCNFIFNIKSAFIFYCKSVHRRYPISQRHRPVFGCFFNG